MLWNTQPAVIHKSYFLVVNGDKWKEPQTFALRKIINNESVTMLCSLRTVISTRVNEEHPYLNLCNKGTKPTGSLLTCLSSPKYKRNTTRIKINPKGKKKVPCLVKFRKLLNDIVPLRFKMHISILNPLGSLG